MAGPGPGGLAARSLCISLQPFPTGPRLLLQQASCHPAASQSTSPRSLRCHAASSLWAFCSMLPSTPLWRTNAQPWGALAHSHLASGPAWTARHQGSLCDLPQPPNLSQVPLPVFPKAPCTSPVSISALTYPKCNRPAYLSASSTYHARAKLSDPSTQRSAGAPS